MTSLDIIIKSKLGKQKRQARIDQLEKELGIGKEIQIEPNHINSASTSSIACVNNNKREIINKREMPTLSDNFVIPNGKNFKLNEHVKSTKEYEHVFNKSIKGIVIDDWLMSHPDPAQRRGYDVRLDNGVKTSINGYWLEMC